MALRRKASSPSQPRPVPGSSPSNRPENQSPVSGEISRRTSIARLASPIPSNSGLGTPQTVHRISAPSQPITGTESPLAGPEGSNLHLGPGRSALAAAFQGSFGGSPPRFGTPPIRPLSPASPAVATPRGREQQSRYGSFDMSSVDANRSLNEDPEVVKRHLVQPSNVDRKDDQGITEQNSRLLSSSPQARSRQGKTKNVTIDTSNDEFSSLQLQGGDVTRQVYRWTEEADAQSQLRGRGKRSKSFNVSRPQPENEVLNIDSIKKPGGFRRNFLRRMERTSSSSSASQESSNFASVGGRRRDLGRQRHPLRPFTSNFLEFLTLYGHFAGEKLEESEDENRPEDYFSSGGYLDEVDYAEDNEDDDHHVPSERSALLTPRTPGSQRRKSKEQATPRQTTPTGAALLLLKSFVGTGVLFLPKAYLNGGMLFSNIVLLGVALLSYYCFILLVNTRLKVEGSFGDIGGVLYGSKMRGLILASIVLSQMGFVAAYIVFTSENLRAFVLAVTRCRQSLDIKYFILLQLGIFLPVSLYRNIAKLGGFALVADVFIVLGLIYLYYYDVFTLVANHGVADIAQFNPRDWTLFIGTAIFTFEGIGLIIPIQESMKKPTKFPKVLAIVMVIITAIFVSMGAISYAAFGSSTKTVIITNLPQDDKLVNAVQCLYSVAIMLSTPLQLFPAIRILENEIFTRSGKNNMKIKWQKNGFRFILVMICAVIAWGGAGDLDKFVSVIGSFACVPLVYIYPVSPYFKDAETWLMNSLASPTL